MTAAPRGGWVDLAPPGGEPEAGADAAGETGETGAATYLYAITRPVRARRLAGVTGVATAPVRVLAADGLGCLVSTVPLAEFGEPELQRNLGDLSWLERTARAHDGVIRAATELVTTAPLRLATVCTDDEAAIARLCELAGPAAALLDRLDGRIEWGVKVFAAEPAGVDRTDPSTDAAGARSGSDYLRRRRAEATRREQASSAAAEDAEYVYRQLAGAAAAAHLHRPQDPALSGERLPMLLNAAFLVDRARSPEFAQLAERCATDRPAVRIDVTGPWPPYSFAVLDP